jgi:ubiquinone/menaquinone biosynthesis C-methylase UbiE
MRLVHSSAMAQTSAQWKRAAIDCWTADPCGAETANGEPGTRAFFDRLLNSRRSYAPWMAEALDYAGAAGLDVLDVGCGQGIDLAEYALAGANATGIDLTARHVQLANQHLQALGLRGQAVEGDAENLPFPDQSFDRVSSNGVLHHTPDMSAALREIRRVLRPGGHVRVIVYNRRSLHFWLTQFLWHGLVRGRLLRTRSLDGVMSETVERTSVGARPLVHAYSPGEVASMLRSAGFAAVSTHVRHFQSNDTPPTKALSMIGLELPVAARDRLGRIAGWYVVAHGRAPR